MAKGRGRWSVSQKSKLILLFFLFSLISYLLYKILILFSWLVLLSAIEVMSKCSNLKWFHCKSFEHFDVISMIDEITDHGN